MVNLTKAVTDRVQEMVCSGLSGAGDFYGLLSSAGLPTGIAEYFIEKGQAFACGESSPDGSGYGQPPPFSGGQCEGDTYAITVSYSFVDRFGGGSNSSTYNIAGKITSIEVFEDTNIEISGTVFPCGITTVIQSSTTGEFRDTPVRGFNCPITLNSTPSITLVNVTTGGADGCGDPPGEPAPPAEEWETQYDVEYDDKDGNPITIPGVSFKLFKVCANEDGLRVPFEVDLGFAKLCGKAGIGVDIGDLLVGENPVSPSVDFDLCPEEIDGLEEVGGDEKRRLFELDPPRGFNGFAPFPTLDGSNTIEVGEGFTPILAVFVKSAPQNPPNLGGKTVVLKTAGQTYPETILPYIALVRFKVAIPIEGGGYSYGYSEDYRVKNQDYYKECEAPEGAVDVEVSWEPGWVGTWEAARAKTCCEFCKDNDPRDGAGNVDRCRVD